MSKIYIVLFVLLCYICLGIYTPWIFNPIFFPNPVDIFESFINIVKNGMLIDGMIYSFSRITIATLISISISIPLGISVALYPSLDKIITPFTNSFRFVPVTALFPLLIMWFGIDEMMKIVFLVIATIFFLLPVVLNEVKNVDVELIETSYTMGMSTNQVIFYTIIPAIAPSLCQSMITMYGIGWTYIIIAEVINSQKGIGFLMNIAASRGRTDMVFACLFTIILFSYIFDALCSYFIKKNFKWKFLRQIKVS